VDRHLLWADEFFSLAMATGHSLEHPASDAIAALGDFVEAPGVVPAASYSRYLAHESPPASLRRVVRAVFLSDTSPPVYYLLLHGWTRAFGTADRVLALFSLLWAAATLPVLYLLAFRLGGDRAAVSACLLFTLAPVSLYYSVEGRMYSLVWLLAALGAWLTLRLHEGGARPGALLAWSCTGAAGLLTHYFFAFVWTAFVLWLLLWPGRSRRDLLAAGVLLTAVLILPWYLHLAESLARWRITGHWLEGPLTPRQILQAPFQLGWSLLSGRGHWGGIKWVDRIGALVLLIAGLATLARAPGRLLDRSARLLWLWVAAACVGPVVFDLLRGTFASLIPRYALAGMPGAMLLAGVILARLPVGLNVVLLTLLVAAWTPGLARVFRDDAHSWRAYRAAASDLAKWTRPSDLVIVHSIPSGVIGMARYLPDATPMAAWVGQLGRRRMPDDILALTRGRARVALVTIHEVGEPAPEGEWLAAHAGSVAERAYPTARVRYFSDIRPPGADAETVGVEAAERR
jgi:4-amino-4-deoxy-L-arabinose transferase-like glycosyltransferase